MISRVDPQQQARAKLLIFQGISHLSISKRLGLHRATIARIARGDLEAPEPREDHPPGYDERQKRRCPTCGHLVYLWPCLACELETPTGPPAAVPAPPPRQDERRRRADRSFR